MNHSTTDNQLITFNDFMKVDIRTGTVVAVEDFPEARKPAFKLTIDFGSDIGVKRSSAQITVRYKKEELVGRQIVAVVNFPPRQIANFFSEVLVLGSVDTEGVVVLLTPDARVENGLRIA
ncbi:MAG: tRNA-binding protein [Chloroflexia bacterium]|nr:tRNA-binding protein [Chloroflexia bacterium]